MKCSICGKSPKPKLKQSYQRYMQLQTHLDLAHGMDLGMAAVILVYSAMKNGVVFKDRCGVYEYLADYMLKH